MVKTHERGTSKKCIKCGVNKPLLDFPKNKNARDGHLGTCKKCQREAIARARKDNPEHHKAIAAKSRIKRRDARNACTIAWRDSNPTKVHEYNTCESRRGIRNAAAAKRRASKLLASPDVWGDPEWYEFTIKEIYEHARTLSDITGTPYEVDHVVPLQSDKVCGLHVPENLRVIPMTENRKKSNLFEDIV